MEQPTSDVESVRQSTGAGAGANRGSGTRRNSGIENSTHQTRDAQERQSRRLPCVAQAECRRRENPRDVEGEQQAAAEVSESVPSGRYAIDLVPARNVRQERVVERQARGEPDVADAKQTAARNQSPRATSARQPAAMQPIAMNSPSSRFLIGA